MNTIAKPLPATAAAAPHRPCLEHRIGKGTWAVGSIGDRVQPHDTLVDGLFAMVS